jgi:hypothetical protein
MRKPRAALLAALAAAALLLAVATPAQASTPWEGPPWQPSQLTITVSDRNGYDLNENEAAYAWGSWSYDDMTMAYTNYQTCTECIIVQTASLYPGTGSYTVAKTTYRDLSNNLWIKRCVITVDPAQVGGYWKARQAVVTHAIGHCLGLANATAGDSIMNHYNLTHPDNAYVPSTDDYLVLDKWYSVPRLTQQ